MRLVLAGVPATHETGFAAVTEAIAWMHSNPGKGAMSILLILAILLALALVQNAIDKGRK